MVNVFNYMDNFIFVISLNRKIKFTNKAVMNKIKINLKDIIDTPVKDCLYTNGKSINNLIDGLGKDEDINFVILVVDSGWNLQLSTYSSISPIICSILLLIIVHSLLKIAFPF